MFLAVRMALYIAFSWIGGLSWAEFSEAEGLLTINAEKAATAAIAFGGTAVTWWAGRRSKAKGGLT